MKRLLQGVCTAAIALVAVGCSPFPTATNSSDEGAPQLESAAETRTDDTTLAASSSTTSTTIATTTTEAPPLPDELPLPVDIAELAEAISEAEESILRTDLDPATVAAWGRRQQALYRLLSIKSDWADETLALVTEDVRDAAALNWRARQQLSSLVGTKNLRNELPAWNIVEPEPPEVLIPLYKAASAQTGVDWEYLAAINLVETRMGRIRGVSSAGAVGPMQFLPTTWAECCKGNPEDPADAIAGAAKYLVDRGGPDNMPKALRGYNNSDYYVQAVSAYAEVLRANEQAYFGYHAWQVYVLTQAGLLRLTSDYSEPQAVNAQEWAEANPDKVFAVSATN